MISPDQVSWHQSWTGADPFGRLFEWEGQLFRAVKPTYRPVYQRLVESGLVQRLTEVGLLVETEETPYHLDGYDRVIRHRRLPIVSYPFEWPGVMLRDAALAVLDLSLHLSDHGLGIVDPGPWNVLFDGCQPVFVDLTSIRAYDDTDLTASLAPWPGYEFFCHQFLYPLYIMADGHERIARSLMRDSPWVPLDAFRAFRGRTRQTVRERLTRGAFGSLGAIRKRVPKPLRPVLKRAARVAAEAVAQGSMPRRARRAFLERLRDEVASVRLYTLEQSGQPRGGVDSASFSPSDSLNQRLRLVERVLERCRPLRVVDVRCGGGWFAHLAGTRGYTVIAFDRHAAEATALYQRARPGALSIVPLVMDIMSPSPAYGVCNRQYSAAFERLRSDMVFGLDVVHQLALSGKLDFEHIVEALDQFCTRWLLVEFVAASDPACRQYPVDWYPWYTWENFTRALMKQFTMLDIMETGSTTRRLLLCEKIDGPTRAVNDVATLAQAKSGV